MKKLKLIIIMAMCAIIHQTPAQIDIKSVRLELVKNRDGHFDISQAGGNWTLRASPLFVNQYLCPTGIDRSGSTKINHKDLCEAIADYMFRLNPHQHKVYTKKEQFPSPNMQAYLTIKPDSVGYQIRITMIHFNPQYNPEASLDFAHMQDASRTVSILIPDGVVHYPAGLNLHALSYKQLATFLAQNIKDPIETGPTSDQQPQLQL